MGTTAEKLTYMSNCIDDAYIAVREKGAPLESSQPLERLASAIRSIPTEGVGEHEIRFIDIDGTLLHNAKYKTGENGIFPADTPSKQWLNFIGWTHTQIDLNNLNYRFSEDDHIIPGHIDVGAMYETSDGKTHVFCKIRKSYSMVIGLYFSKIGTNNAAMNIDWNDGSTIEKFNITNSTKSHTYSTEGDYHITIWSDNNVVYGMGGGAIGTAVVTTGKESVIKFYPSNYVSLKNYAYYQFKSLREAFLPQYGTNTILPNFCFQDCGAISAVICPRGYNTELPTYFMHQCFNASYVVIPTDIKSLGASCLRFSPKITRIVIPSGINIIPAGCFMNGGVVELISDVITSVGDTAFSSNYPGRNYNLANELIVGTDCFTNNFSYAKKNPVLFLKTDNSNGLISWAQFWGEKITIRGEAGLILPPIGNIHSCTRLIIGSNFTSLKGAINTFNILEYVFEGEIPPTVSNPSFLNGTTYPSSLNKLAKFYVPDNAVNTYKTATNWSVIAGYIYPMSQLS